MSGLRIYQIGAVPPPFGGVAVHVQRLHERLLRDGFDARVLDISGVPKTLHGVRNISFKIAAFKLFLARRSLLHFHNFSIAAARAFHWLAKRHETVLSFHNERFGAEIAAAAKSDRCRVIAALRCMKFIVVDGEHTKAQLAALIGDSDIVKVIPEFIPATSEPDPAKTLPPEINAIRDRYRFLLATSASDLVVERGQDRYGIDILIQAVAQLRKLAVDVCAIIVVPNLRNEAHLRALQELAASLQVSQFVFLVREPVARIEPLWQIADLVVRATNTDGNALTIWEALACGTPVIASDCVLRPAGVILFRNRDIDDLTERTAAALSNIQAERMKVRNLAIPDHAAEIIALYRSLV